MGLEPANSDLGKSTPTTRPGGRPVITIYSMVYISQCSRPNKIEKSRNRFSHIDRTIYVYNNNQALPNLYYI